MKVEAAELMKKEEDFVKEILQGMEKKNFSMRGAERIADMLKWEIEKSNEQHKRKIEFVAYESNS